MIDYVQPRLIIGEPWVTSLATVHLREAK